MRAGSRALFALALLSSCKHAPRAVPSTASRVVSLSPSTTEAIAALGATSALVGRSRYCDFPPEVLPLPVVGGFVDPSYEAILGLRPDLVTGARGPSGPTLSERLGARGVATYFPETESFAEIDAMLLGLGARVGRERRATELVAEIDAAEDRVTRAVEGRPRVRVLLLFGLTPIVAAGPQGFPDEMVRRAGGENVVAGGGAYPTIGLEHVLTLDPDVVVDAAWGEAAGTARVTAESPGWRELRAVKAGRVITLREESVLRPGPRIADGLRLLARALHPEADIP